MTSTATFVPLDLEQASNLADLALRVGTAIVLVMMLIERPGAARVDREAVHRATVDREVEISDGG